MDYEIIALIAPMVIGSLTWQFSAIHMERFLANHDPDHVPPGILSRLFIGRLFTTFPLIAPYNRIRKEQGSAPIGVFGFFGGLALTLVGLAVLFGFLSTL